MLELAILMPFVIVCLLVVVAFGRVNRGRQLVDQASQAAARAGSLASTPGAAQTSAQIAADSTLASAGMSCQAVTVLLDTSHWYAGGEVVAKVTCTSNLSGLALAGVPGTVSLTSSSTSVLERYRQFGSG
nr:TadE/TadG family type IV pilus assembly protein [Jatrophihabitans sp. GAS493]